jgi:hypothetical protein
MDADAGLIAKWADKLSVSAALVSAGAMSRSVPRQHQWHRFDVVI